MSLRLTMLIRPWRNRLVTPTNQRKYFVHVTFLILASLVLTPSDHSLIGCETTTGFNPSYYRALAFDKELGATYGIDAALEMYSLDALVLPAPGCTSIPAGKPRPPPPFSSCSSPVLRPAIAGYPIVTGTFPSRSSLLVFITSCPLPRSSPRVLP